MESYKFESKDVDGKKLLLEIRKPTQRLLQESDEIYHIEYGKLSRKECLFNAEVLEMIEERGIQSTRWEKEYTETLQEVVDVEKQFNDSKDKKGDEDKNDEKQYLALRLRLLRQKLIELSSRTQGIYRHTVENIAEERKMLFLCTRCTFFTGTDNQYFKDENDFLENDDQDVAVDALTATYKYFHGVAEFGNNEFPENEYLKDVGVLDSNYEFATVDVEEIKDEDTKKSVKSNKKKSRKKKATTTAK